MNNEWSLNDLYTGYDDPVFKADQEAFIASIKTKL